MPGEGPEFFAASEVLRGIIDQIDYFQILMLPRASTAKDIKSAYYRLSRIYHPDRFHQLPEPEVREKLNTIFKRVNEAYVVLRDEKKRAKYLADTSGPERAKKLRYTEASEAEQKAQERKAVEEQIGTTPKGRDCFKHAEAEIEAQHWDAAVRHLKMALMYEPSNARFKETLQQVQAELDKSRPRNDFKIK